MKETNTERLLSPTVRASLKPLQQKDLEDIHAEAFASFRRIFDASHPDDSVTIGIPCPDNCGAILGNAVEQQSDGTWKVMPITDSDLENLSKRLELNPHIITKDDL